MAYLALARKYRPQRFADMIGQEHVTRTLENAIRTDRVHHAYLFCGVRGLGKTTAARILAKCLVCEKGPTPEPCDECHQCVAIREGHSVDVIEIDGASNNSVDDVRSLREQVNYLPQTARRKIYIIDEVHMLSQAAFNALLKTLEEPPPHVTFMFATTDPHKVLPTILSRVSRLDYRRVRAATLVPYLREIVTKEGFSVEDEGLHVIARCGEGSVRDSLTLLDKVIAFAEDPKAITTAEVLTVLGQASRFAVAELVQAVLDHDAEAVLARFEQITSVGSDLMQLALAILQHLRDLAVVALTGSRAALLDMSDDLHEQLARQAEGVEPSVIAQHFDRFARVVDNLENSRVPRLVIEMGLLELVNAEPLLPLGDLVSRLDALSRGASGAGGGRGGSGGGRRTGGRGGRTPARQGGGARRADPADEPQPHARPRPHEAPRAVETPTPSPTPPRRGRPPAGPSATNHVDVLEQMARDAGLLPGSGGAPSPSPRPLGPGAPADRGPSTSAPPRPASEPARPDLRPASPPPNRPASGSPPGHPPGSQDFSLTNEELEPAETPADPEAGCPSSRCAPREAIPWRTLSPWDAWESFLTHIRDEHDLLWAVLLDLGLVGIREGLVELAAPATGFAQTQLRDNPELKTAFAHLTGVYFGEAMRLELIDATPSLPDTPSMGLVDAQRQRQHREAIAQDAASHPRIRALLTTFGAELRRIEPLTGPALPPVGQRGLPGE